MTDAAVVISKLLGLGVGAGMVFVAYIVRRHAGSWMVPGSVFSLLWAGFTLVPLVLVPTAGINLLALIYIFAACAVFALGAWLLPWPLALAANRAKPGAHASFSTPVIWAWFIATTLASLVFIVGALAVQGFTWEDLLLNLLATSAKFASMRYADELTPTVFTQASLLSSYVATALGGLLFAARARAKGRWLIAVASFLPAILIMVTQSAKGVLFLSIAYFWGAISVCRVFDGETRLASRQGLRQLAKATLLLLPLVGFSFLARGMTEADDAGDIGEMLRYYFASYLFAHLYAFSDWFSAYIGDPASLEYAPNGARLGLYTFYGLFQLLGDPPALPQGVYDEYFSIETLFASNIYTIYRGLLMDFGIAGSLVFLLASSWVAHLMFLLLLGSNRPHAAVAGYIIMTGAIVHSFLSSLLMYNSTYATFAVLWLVLAMNGALRHRTSGSGRPHDVAVAGPDLARVLPKA